MIESIYFDSCALNRLTDDLTQPRIRAEAESVAYALDELKAGRVEWLASTILSLEVSRNPHVRHRNETIALLNLATATVAPDRATAARAAALQQVGFGPFDALHIALAEHANVQTFLTVDDRLLRNAARHLSGANLTLENPIDWRRRRQPWLIKR